MNAFGFVCVLAAAVACDAGYLPHSLAVVRHGSLAPTSVHIPSASYAPLAGHPPVVTPVRTQYHAQDELGQYSFGYSGGPSSRSETRDAYGRVRGSFSYVDPYGSVQSQRYVADEGGFRVEGTNLPRHKRSHGASPTLAVAPAEYAASVAPVVHASPAVVPVAPVAYSDFHGYGLPIRSFSRGYYAVPALSTYRSYGSLPLSRHDY